MRKYLANCPICHASVTSSGPNPEDRYCKFGNDHQVYCDVIEVGRYRVTLFQNRVFIMDLNNSCGFIEIFDVTIKPDDIDSQEKVDQIIMNYQLMK